MAERAKSLLVHPDRCTACHMCELACSMRQRGAFNPAHSRIQVSIFPEEGIYLPFACYQCADAPCEAVCPTGALRVNGSTGLVDLHRAKCIGCKMCLVGCPFGVMHFYLEMGVADKCDLCGGEPECVKFCVPRALEFGEAQPLTASARARRIARQEVA
ncbi:MAG: 4Fe-4S dicluster domain-containing protein [Nitrospinota bacterium]